MFSTVILLQKLWLGFEVGLLRGVWASVMACLYLEILGFKSRGSFWFSNPYSLYKAFQFSYSKTCRLIVKYFKLRTDEDFTTFYFVVPGHSKITVVVVSLT